MAVTTLKETLFTIYKTTNLINGRFYVGMHKTNDLDDGYMGSGKMIQRAIKKQWHFDKCKFKEAE